MKPCDFSSALRIASAVALLAWPAAAPLAQDLPVPPCAGEAFPAAGGVGESLEQLVRVDDEALDDWSPPSCTGWEAGPATALLAASGRFSMAGDSSVFADRVAAISSMTDLQYWSATRSKWRHLFKEAAALRSPERKAERADFDGDDLRPGTELYFWLREDNPTAGVVYQMLIRERTPDRLVFETVNLTPLKAQILLLIRPEIAAPGEFRQLYFVERETDDIWRYYTMVRMGRASGLAGTSEANYRNRAEAYFRFLAELPMTREPPAAR